MADLENGYGNRQSINSNEQRKGIQDLNRILLSILQVKYQGVTLSPAILSSYVGVNVIYTFACFCYGRGILSSSNVHLYLPLLRVTVSLMGGLAIILLLIAIVPSLGWIGFTIWVITALKLIWSIRKQIYALVRRAQANCILPR